MMNELACLPWSADRRVFFPSLLFTILNEISCILYNLLFLSLEGWEADRYPRSRRWNKKSGSDVKSRTAMNAVACRVSTLDLPRSKPSCLTTRERSSARYVWFQDCCFKQASFRWILLFSRFFIYIYKWKMAALFFRKTNKHYSHGTTPRLVFTIISRGS